LKDIKEPVCLFRVNRVRCDEAAQKVQNGPVYLLYFHGGR
jgi:hypothetical protein